MSSNRLKAIISFLLFILVFGAAPRMVSWVSMMSGNLSVLQEIGQRGTAFTLYYPLGSCDPNIRSTTDAYETPALPVPTSASLYLQGLAAMNNGDWLGAEQLLGSAQSTGTNAEWIAYAMGFTRLMAGRDPIPYWQIGGSVNRFLKAGDECILIGNGDLAAAYYNMALQLYEAGSSMQISEVGELVVFFARTPDLSYFERALGLFATVADPSSLEYHVTLGRAYIAQQEPEQALKHLLQAANISSKDPSIWYQIGQGYMQIEDYESARSAFYRAIQLAPNTLSYLTWMGHSYFYSQQYDDAEEWYIRALDVDDRNNNAIGNLIRIRLQQKRYTEAYDLAVRLMAVDKRAYVRELAAVAAVERQDWESALTYIDKAIALEPENLRFYQLLARICEATSDIECMKRAYQGILDLEPSNTSIQQKLNAVTELP